MNPADMATAPSDSDLGHIPGFGGKEMELSVAQHHIRCCMVMPSC